MDFSEIPNFKAFPAAEAEIRHPNLSSNPSRYFCVVAMRKSHQGAPTTRTTSKAKL